MQELKIKIPIPPRTKKNSQRIVKTKNGGHCILPSKQYTQYEKDAMWFIPGGETIKHPVNVKAVFYMDTRRRVDLVNLQEALLDVLVRAGLLEDDNCTIVASMDGSRVLYDKERPRTEVIITEAKKAEAIIDDITAERYEIAKILSENFTPAEYDDSDFEWCAYQLQMAGYHKQ